MDEVPKNRDQPRFLCQAVNRLFFAVKLDILTWESMLIDSLLDPASSGHSRNCRFGHLSVAFIYSVAAWGLNV